MGLRKKRLRLWRGSDPLPASPKFQKRGIWGRGRSVDLKTDLHAQIAIVPPPFSVFEYGLLRGDMRFIPPPFSVFENGGG